MEKACAEVGRDPVSLGKSVTEIVDGGASEIEGFGEMLPADPNRLAEAAHEFAEMGFTSMELGIFPEGLEMLETVGEVVRLLDG